MTDEQAAALEEQIPALRRYARFLVRDPDHADDLVQDCLERAVSRFHLFKPGTNLRAWLFTILHNQFVNTVRRQAREGTVLSIDGWRAPAATSPTQEIPLHLRDFARAFERLPEGCKSVLLLIGVDGLSYEEAAAVLDIPTGTVRSRLSRGREKLRAFQIETGGSAIEDDDYETFADQGDRRCASS